MSDVADIVNSLRSCLEVIKDAMRQPANSDSFPIVSELVAEVREAHASLQKKANEALERGEAVEGILEALELANEIEPRYEEWRGSFGSPRAPSRPSITPEAPVPPPPFEPDVVDSKRRSKKKKSSADLAFEAIEWDAFPEISNFVDPPSVNLEISNLPPLPDLTAVPLKGTVRIDLPWKDVGPLLSDEENQRTKKMEDFFRDSVAKSLKLNPNRIKAFLRLA